MGDEHKVPGHVFLSYVRDDVAAVDRLQRVLEAAGIRVWRDTGSLWPGQDWRTQIRRAITDDALVFIACFSSNSGARDKSYQNEELTLAIEQLRERRQDESWLIPLRLDDCIIPDRDIGGGRTLASIEMADVFGASDIEGIARLVATVLRVLGRRTGAASAPPRSAIPGPDAARAAAVAPDQARIQPIGAAYLPARLVDAPDAATETQPDNPRLAVAERWGLPYPSGDIRLFLIVDNQSEEHYYTELARLIRNADEEIYCLG